MRRLIDSDIGEIVGEGRQARVHALADGRVVKLFRPTVSPARARREYVVSGLVHAAGAPTWRVDELVAVGDTVGIVGERIEGVALSDWLAQPSKLPRVVWTLLNLQMKVRALAPADLAPFAAGGRATAYLGGAVYHGAVMADHAVCHGDLCPKNVIVQPCGRAVLVDWGRAFYGPVVADVVWTNRHLQELLVAREPLRPRRTFSRAAVVAHQFLACRKMRWPMFKLSLILSACAAEFEFAVAA